MQLTLHTDGGARGNPGPAGIGIFVQDELGAEIHSHKAFLGTKTNNEAEYEALLYATQWLSRFCSTEKVSSSVFLLDSLLVVSQVKGQWKIKEQRLLPYRTQIVETLNALPISWQIRHVPRSENAEADALVNQALDQAKTTSS